MLGSTLKQDYLCTKTLLNIIAKDPNNKEFYEKNLRY